MTNLISHLKNQWENLLPKERYIITIGASMTVVVLLYACIWSPLSDAVLHRKAQAASRQELLIEMQKASQKIMQFKTQGISVDTAPIRNGLLAFIEQSLTSQHLSNYLKQVQQTQNNQITLTFENVPFDQLMQWMQSMVMIHSLRVKNLSAVRLAVTGTANVQIVLES